VTHVGIFRVIELQKRPIAQVFEPTGSVGHGSFQHFVAQCQKDVPGWRTTEHCPMGPIGRTYLLIEVDGDRTVNADATPFQNSDKIVKKFFGSGHCFQRPRAVAPAQSLSIGIFGSLAGSDGGMQQPSATPTITCLRGSHSFQELTTVGIEETSITSSTLYSFCPPVIF